ncbi:diadenosine tetraphosphate (Ap4A) HIT family hydrolase [Georgenia soli]|uniref:Diadenosine tetraphosphate (Ap4A) HIT family hydrolase n=1 Tax=Georgenia soli TaxID=638953 RepID=A0A2A9EQH6_9MICO|nr:HIT family protein [Georgenia soli]PFG41234.1 diadenosine tetraphosphate (Ap4A) HIT family hydrolase [Georgenia soli]
MSTVFTQIIDGRIPGRFVWADERCVVFSTIAPITDGHMLVVPREEVDQYTDADDELLAHLAVVAKNVGRAQQAAFGSPRAAVLVAGFEVEHLHLHVLPAWDEQSLRFDNARHDVPGEELDAAAERVREALREAGHGDRVPVQLSSAALG